MDYKLQQDLNDPSQIPAEGIHSRTVFNDDNIRVVWFAFAQGEVLSEHTASMPAVVHVLHGQFDITLANDTIDGTPGTWLHMAANLPHSLTAQSPSIMLLTLIKA